MFDNTPAAQDGTLQSGDEIVAISGRSCKGSTKVEVAKMIQATKVRIQASKKMIVLQTGHCLLSIIVARETE